MNRILGNIYVSGIEPVYGDLGPITDVVSVVPGDLPDLSHYNHLQIHLLDDDHSILFIHLPRVFKFMNSGLFGTENPNVKSNHKRHLLIHCHEGLNRSVCVLICYLIRYYRLTLTQAIYAIKRKQPIRISDWFMKQLELFELVKGDLTDLRIREFLIENMDNGYDVFGVLKKEVELKGVEDGSAEEVSAEDTSTEGAHTEEVSGEEAHTEKVSTDEPKENSTKETPTEDPSHLITCKKCRNPLAKSSQILRHTPPDISSHQLYFKNQLAHDKCTHYFLKDPLKWMNINSQEEVLDGKLNCPGCNSKIGGFSWKGSRCSCGKWITPSFNLLISKVDVKNGRGVLEV